MLCPPCLSTKFNLELIYLNQSFFHTSFKLLQRGNLNIPTHYGLKEFQKISLPYLCSCNILFLMPLEIYPYFN